MIYDISMDLNGIPLCVNVYPMNLEGNLCQLTDTLNWIPKQPSNKRKIHPILLKRNFHSILNKMPLFNLNESQWSIPLCVNVYPINLEGNLCQLTDTLNWIPKQPSNKREIHPIQLKFHSILNGIALINFNESQWSMKIQMNPNEASHYVSMHIQLILKETFVDSLIYWIESPSCHEIKEKFIQFNWAGSFIQIKGKNIQFNLRGSSICEFTDIYWNKSQWGLNDIEWNPTD